MIAYGCVQKPIRKEVTVSESGSNEREEGSGKGLSFFFVSPIIHHIAMKMPKVDVQKRLIRGGTSPSKK